jgi:hypothetical protein
LTYPQKDIPDIGVATITSIRPGIQRLNKKGPSKFVFEERTRPSGHVFSG